MVVIGVTTILTMVIALITDMVAGEAHTAMVGATLMVIIGAITTGVMTRTMPVIGMAIKMVYTIVVITMDMLMEEAESVNITIPTITQLEKEIPVWVQMVM